MKSHHLAAYKFYTSEYCIIQFGQAKIAVVENAIDENGVGNIRVVKIATVENAIFVLALYK